MSATFRPLAKIALAYPQSPKIRTCKILAKSLILAKFCAWLGRISLAFFACKVASTWALLAISLDINAENHARILLSVFCIFALDSWLDFAKRLANFSQKNKAKFYLQSQKLKTTKKHKNAKNASR